MLLHTSADEARARGEDKVAADPFPDEMKIVARVPHVLTRARDQIRLPPRVVGRGTSCPADLRVGGKDADVTLRAEDIGAEGGTQREREHEESPSCQCAAPP